MPHSWSESVQSVMSRAGNFVSDDGRTGTGSDKAFLTSRSDNDSIISKIPDLE
jgi:hypothetical protein